MRPQKRNKIYIQFPLLVLLLFWLRSKTIKAPFVTTKIHFLFGKHINLNSPNPCLSSSSIYSERNTPL